MTEFAERHRPRRRKILLLVLSIALAMVITGLLTASYLLPEEEAASIAAFPVQQGEFVIALTMKGGELEAIKAENVPAPQVRGKLKITHLFPEGEQVQVGDLLAEFDKVEFEKWVSETQQTLDVSKAEMEKATANQEAEIARLEGEILDQEAQVELARLQIEKMKFESSIQKEETKLQAKQAELRLKLAKRKLEAQRVVDKADTKQITLDIERKQRDLDKAKSDLAGLQVKAKKPGLVVYAKKWTPTGPTKLRVGDEVWGGESLITLPDLSRMQVKAYVNEVDVDKLEVGQPASIKLDALPEPTFHGSISSIANLGREKEGAKNVKVFDVMIEIEEEDERLKPGMSATSTIVVETIPPRPKTPPDSIKQSETEEVPTPLPEPLYIPLDAVFEKGDETVVYRLQDGQPIEQIVVLGKQNEDYVIIEEGLGPDDRVTLRDPGTVLEKLGGIPDEKDKSKATSAIK